jgi:hypothetical protein
MLGSFAPERATGIARARCVRSHAPAKGVRSPQCPHHRARASVWGAAVYGRSPDRPSNRRWGSRTLPRIEKGKCRAHGYRRGCRPRVRVVQRSYPSQSSAREFVIATDGPARAVGGGDSHRLVPVRYGQVVRTAHFGLAFPPGDRRASTLRTGWGRFIPLARNV